MYINVQHHSFVHHSDKNKQHIDTSHCMNSTPTLCNLYLVSSSLFRCQNSPQTPSKIISTYHIKKLEMLPFSKSPQGPYIITFITTIQYHFKSRCIIPFSLSTSSTHDKLSPRTTALPLKTAFQTLTQQTHYNSYHQAIHPIYIRFPGLESSKTYCHS